VKKYLLYDNIYLNEVLIICIIMICIKYVILCVLRLEHAIEKITRTVKYDFL